MPRGYMSEFTRRVESVREETVVYETQVNWLTLSCGHVLRTTGKTAKMRPSRVNCPQCEFSGLNGAKPEAEKAS